MTAVVQKYPSKRSPFRHVRRVEESCCYARDGRPKASFGSRTAALDKVWLGQEPYPCGQHDSRWHLRTKRS